jgi:hypothetical protein
MSLAVADLNLPAASLAQIASALGDGSGTNAALLGICNAASADVTRLTNGYVIDAASLTNFGRALALYRAYGQVGPVPPDVEKNYEDAWKELQSIAMGQRKNIPRADDGAPQSTSTGGFGGQRRVHTGMTDDCCPINFNP